MVFQKGTEHKMSFLSRFCTDFTGLDHTCMSSVSIPITMEPIQSVTELRLIKKGTPMLSSSLKMFILRIFSIGLLI